MSEVLATSPQLPDESPTVEGRLADIIATAEEIRIDGYRLSNDDRAKVVAALRGVLAGKLPCDVKLPPRTIIGKGCSMQTLLVGLEQRKRWLESDRRFPR